VAYFSSAYHASQDFTDRSIHSLLMIALYTAACIILVNNGRKYTGMILKDEPEGSWEDASEWDLDRRNIILVLFIGMGLYTLIQSIPHAVNGLYEIFAQKVDADIYKHENLRKDSLVIELLKTTIGAVLIYGAPTLTNFIEKHVYK